MNNNNNNNYNVQQQQYQPPQQMAQLSGGAIPTGQRQRQIRSVTLPEGETLQKLVNEGKYRKYVYGTTSKSNIPRWNKASDLKITGAQKMLTDNPNMVYVPQLRIAGDLDQIRSLLTSTGNNADAILARSYSVSNLNTNQQLQQQFQQEVSRVSEIKGDSLAKKADESIDEHMAKLERANNGYSIIGLEITEVSHKLEQEITKTGPNVVDDIMWRSGYPSRVTITKNGGGAVPPAQQQTQVQPGQYVQQQQNVPNYQQGNNGYLSQPQSVRSPQMMMPSQPQGGNTMQMRSI
jgi:hypothetical protein